MKKFLILIALVLIATLPVFAYTDAFNATTTNKDYIALVTAIKENQSEEVVLSAYNTYVNAGISEVAKARVQYEMAKYYRGKKDKDTARSYVDNMRKLIDSIPADSITDYEKRVLEIEYYSAKYDVDKKMSDGLENSKLTKELYELYPDDVQAIMLNNWRLIYTPAIAGGSPRKAIKSIEALLKDYGSEMSDLDTYSAYHALAIAHNMRDDYENADKYFKKAFEYFSNESDVVDAYKDNQKEMRKASR